MASLARSGLAGTRQLEARSTRDRDLLLELLGVTAPTHAK